MAVLPKGPHLIRYLRQRRKARHLPIASPGSTFAMTGPRLMQEQSNRCFPNRHTVWAAMAQNYLRDQPDRRRGLLLRVMTPPSALKKRRAARCGPKTRPCGHLLSCGLAALPDNRGRCPPSIPACCAIDPICDGTCDQTPPEREWSAYANPADWTSWQRMLPLSFWQPAERPAAEIIPIQHRLGLTGLPDCGKHAPGWSGLVADSAKPKPGLRGRLRRVV